MVWLSLQRKALFEIEWLGHKSSQPKYHIFIALVTRMSEMFVKSCAERSHYVKGGCLLVANK